jgi:DHA2 family multidrug resistance protein
LIFDPPYLKKQREHSSFRIDYIGIGLLALGLAFLEIVLDEGQREDWFSSHLIIISSVIAAVALISVIVWELRQEHPVIDLRMLKERNFALATVTMFLLGFVLYASTMLLPIFLQTLLGYTAMRSGLVLSPGGLAIIVLMPVVGKLLSKVEARWLVVGGLAISAMGLFQMAHFNLEIDYRTAMMARVVQSAGLAFLFVPINTTAFAFVAKNKTNYATGLINLARNIGGSTGIAMATTMLARRSQFHQNFLVEHLTPLNQNYQAMLNGLAQTLMQRGADATYAMRQAQAMLYGMVQRQSMMKAFIDNFWLLGITFLAMIPLMFFMKRAGPHKGPVMME